MTEVRRGHGRVGSRQHVLVDIDGRDSAAMPTGHLDGGCAHPRSDVQHTKLRAKLGPSQELFGGTSSSGMNNLLAEDRHELIRIEAFHLSGG
jgi:hypothetical protein